jgi:hypothetical protein
VARKLQPLLGFALLPEPLDLEPLLLDLMLLFSQLLLSLLVGGFLILKRIADRVSRDTTQACADCGAGGGMTDRGTYDRAGGSSQSRPSKGAFFTS